MTDLAIGVTALDLVPGRAEDVERLAARLANYAEGAREAVFRLRQISAGNWVGEAADAFRDAVGEVPAKLKGGVGAFEEAAFELRSYASTLRESQALASRAIELFEEAECRSRMWSVARDDYQAALMRADALAESPLGGPAPATVDPGEALRAEARRLVAEARRAVEDSAHWAAARLNAAADQAPDKPGFFDRALGAVSDFAGGAVEATVGMAEFAFKLTPVYELIDPEGYVENLTGLGQGLVFGVTHPVEFAKGVIDWDTWVDNPARALGHLVPAVALAVASAGAGAAGKAGAAAKAVEGAEALGTTEAAEVSAARTVTRSATEVGEDIGELSGILRDAARGKGNFGLGKATRSEADVLGRAWVGEDYIIASDGKTLVSRDGLRQYRPPSYKPNIGRIQANFEQRPSGITQWQSNGHLEIVE